jgi:hypothetical protein
MRPLFRLGGVLQAREFVGGGVALWTKWLHTGWPWSFGISRKRLKQVKHLTQLNTSLHTYWGMRITMVASVLLGMQRGALGFCSGDDAEIVWCDGQVCLLHKFRDTCSHRGSHINAPLVIQS